MTRAKKSEAASGKQLPLPPLKQRGRVRLLVAGAVVCAVGLVATAMILPVSAQDALGIDIRKIREEAKQQMGENAAFTREVQKRGETARDEALAVQEGSQRNVEQAQAIFDGMPEGDGLLNEKGVLQDGARVRGGNASSGSATGPAFLAFASTSMPPEALRQMARDVTAAGGFMVFRGFPNNNARQFREMLVKVFDKDQATGNIGVDPRLFRAFQVEVVPTYVVTTNEIDLCDGLSCVSDVPPHDRMVGNVTAQYALETFANGGGPGAPASRIYARKLNRGAAG